MKTFQIIALLFLLNLPTLLFAQDKMLTRTGDEYLVKVLEITPDSVFYTAGTDTVNQFIQAIPRQQVFMITFRNGAKEVFQEKPAPLNPELTQEQLFYLGKADAREYYNAKPAYWSAFGSSLIFPLGGPLLGIGVGTAVSLTNPDPAKIGSYHPELGAAGVHLKENPAYIAGFNKAAKSKKFGRAAAGVGTAVVGVFVLAIVAFSTSGF